MSDVLSIFVPTAEAAITAPDAATITSAVTSVETAAGDYVNYLFGILGVIIAFFLAKKVMGYVSRTLRGK